LSYLQCIDADAGMCTKLNVGYNLIALHRVQAKDFRTGFIPNSNHVSYTVY